MHETQNVGLLELLIDGFEKNEVLEGFHWRTLPMPDEASARGKFASLVAEAVRWKGRPRSVETAERCLAAWPDMEIRQSGRGVLLRAKATGFDRWWNDRAVGRAIPWVRSTHGCKTSAISRSPPLLSFVLDL